MDFDLKLKRYAKLLVNCGMAVQRGQIVNISAEACHRELAFLLAEESYRVGAKFVNIDLSEPRLTKLRALNSSDDDLSYFPPHMTVKYREMVDSSGANISITGAEDPDLLSDLDPGKINLQRVSRYKGLKYFYEKGIGENRVQWCVAAAATPKWAAKVFTDLPEEEALGRLWEEIFSICRVDSENYVEEWRKLNLTLRERSKRLTEMKIKTLHFTGPGTDLRVGLSERAIFKGGGEKSVIGVEYQANIPTEECFTTPDYTRTDGRVKCTRPFLINGKLIQGLELEFEAGRVTRFKAKEGEATFREYIDSDPGGRRLGEVALVGVDSPVYKSGHVFEEILFDENAACHIAIGSAYKFCIEGGNQMGAKELEKIGFNESSVHTDMMISSLEVDVTAVTYDGKRVPLLIAGEWVEL